MLTHEGAPSLKAKVIAGAANNQLADSDVAAVLAQHGVLWVPDFVVNAGGIVNIAVELLPGGYDEARADGDVRRIGETVRSLLDESEREGITPLAAAMALAHRRLLPGAA